MQIRYLDQYEETLLEIDSPYMPRLGESVYMGNTDEWVVTKIFWNADSFIGVVILTLAEEMFGIKEEKNTDLTDRLNRLQDTIIKEKGDREELRRKVRQLNEQIVSIRTHIKHKERKPS